MPVTARLSRRFYEKFGDDVANELVEWFNAVDATYRADLREFNELNFARFDAKVEQRFAQQWSAIDRRFAEFEVKLERRFAEQDVKFEQRFAQQDAKFEHRFAQQDAKFERGFAEVRAEIASSAATTKSQILTWMVGLWLTSALGIAALIFAKVV